VRYVEDTGTVVEVAGEEAVVRLDRGRSEACGSCCACSAFGGPEPRLRVECGELQVGDRVTVKVPQVNPCLGMALVFGLPLALFIVGLAAGHSVEGTSQLGTGSLVGGLVGVVVAFLLAWAINKAIRGKAVPETRRLHEKPEAPAPDLPSSGS